MVHHFTAPCTCFRLISVSNCMTMWNSMIQNITKMCGKEGYIILETLQINHTNTYTYQDVITCVTYSLILFLYIIWFKICPE
jgi:hypothetical protein